MQIPKKLVSRKDEITKDFLLLLDKYIADLLDGKLDKMYHTKDFAELLFIHPVHLTNTIRLTTGRSPCDFLEVRILAEAQALLRNTDLSVKEVGYKFNYNEPTNFSKFFKNMSGLTPLQFRKSLLPNT